MMEKLRLVNGLIALGGLKGKGKTLFALQLANELAKKEKVLFLNWQDYGSNLEQLLLEIEGSVAEKLTINSRQNWFSVGAFLEFIHLLEVEKYTTIFIDDVDTFLGGEDIFKGTDYSLRDELIEALSFLVERYKIRIVFVLRLDKLDDEMGEIPSLRDFIWSRLIINDCHQVLGLSETYRVANDRNEVNVASLKEDSLEIEEVVVVC